MTYVTFDFCEVSEGISEVVTFYMIVVKFRDEANGFIDGSFFIIYYMLKRLTIFIYIYLYIFICMNYLLYNNFKVILFTWSTLGS